MKLRTLGITLVSGVVLALLMIHFGESAITSANSNGDHERVIPITETDNDTFSWQVKELMLNSHNYWRTLQAEAVTTWYPTGQEGFQVFTSLQIDGNKRVRVEDVISNEEQAALWIMNDSGIYSNNYPGLDGLEKLSITLSDHYHLLPHDIESINTNVIYMHPIGAALTTPVREYIYPVGFAQRANSFLLKGEEKIVGRMTWVVEWVEEEPASLKQIFWVDQETGIILKALSYVGENTDRLYSETVFTNIVFDAAIPETNFQVSLD